MTELQTNAYALLTVDQQQKFMADARRAARQDGSTEG